jgi:exodeoxyribonuclease V gamma subunit
VEVIRDVILGLLDDHSDLEPRDIVIMTPDIATYAPLIEGSFGQGDWYRSGGSHPWGEAGAPRLQVEIADLSVRRTNPVADALLRVLAAAADRLTASAALDLIALEPVASRFGLGPEDAGRLREIVIQSGIRWGLDDIDRERAGHTSDAQNTFAFGLDRLALGVAMADEGTAIELTPEGGTAITPWDPAEQADTLALLGRFFDFCETLGEVVSSLREPRPLTEWVSHLTDAGTGVLDRLTRTEGVSQWLTQRVRAELLELSLEAEAAHSTHPFRLDALQTLLDGRFEVASGITRQQTGAITCCALRPMRSVPYKVVCLIGMDEGRFPSQATLPGFDWTALAPRAGDKIPRDEDLLMLLEAILSARSHLIVAYTGRSVRTNQPCQPCVPIAELREVIDQTFCASDAAASAALTTAHSLHNFSPVNFRSEPGPPRSFDHRVMAAAEAGLGPRSDPAFLPTKQAIPHALREPDSVIELQTLSDFFSNPARTLLQQRFGLRLQSYTMAVEDQVPVELSGRDQRRIERDLLHRTLEHMRMLGHDLTEQTAISDWLGPVIAHMRATGTLPPGPASGHVLAPQLEVLEHLCAECADLMMSPEHTEQVRIELTVQGRSVELMGQVPHLPDGAMVIFVPRADSTGGAMWWLLGPWIQLLAWMAHAPGERRRLGVVHAFQGDGPKLQYRVFGPDWPVDEQQERARALLQWMVQAYQAGMDRPLALYPQTSFQFAWGIQALNAERLDGSFILPESFEAADTVPSPSVLAGPMKLAHKAWGSADSRSGDARDVHIDHLYGSTRPFLQSQSARPLIPDPVFAATSLRLWQPLIASRQKITAGKKGIAPFLDALDAAVKP